MTMVPFTWGARFLLPFIGKAIPWILKNGTALGIGAGIGGLFGALLPNDVNTVDEAGKAVEELIKAKVVFIPDKLQTDTNKINYFHWDIQKNRGWVSEYPNSRSKMNAAWKRGKDWAYEKQERSMLYNHLKDHK